MSAHADTDSGPPKAAWRASINTRVPDEVKDQVALAAAQCDLSVAEWMRFVIAAALDAHAAQGSPLCTAPADTDDRDDDGYGLSDEVGEPVEPQVGEPRPADDDYEERVRAAARAEREAIAERKRNVAEGRPMAARLNPRECAHLPSRRMGDRCRDCGMRISAAGMMGRRPAIGLGRLR